MARCVVEQVGAVARGAGNDISAKGAMALAWALQGNTTLLTLDLHGM